MKTHGFKEKIVPKQKSPGKPAWKEPEKLPISISLQ